MGARFALLLLGVAASLLIAVPAAQASFHEMSIREVYPGGANDASYVELQMWAAGQEFVLNRHLIAYNSNGSVNEDFEFGASVANGANQSTILVADTNYSLVFDERPLPDASDEKLNLSPAGGAVCWIEGSPPDCVAWGNFTGPLPAHVPELKVGNPAAPTGVKAGKALRRSIAKGCATLLDPPPTDDSDDSTADFAEVEPEPRDNATKAIEEACPTLPNTAIDTKPANPTKLTTASFTYHAIPSTGASFQCSMISGAEPDSFAVCPTGGTSYSSLTAGTYTFKVRAVNEAGSDPTPASYSWTVDLTPPTVEIDSAPPDPSPGANSTFTFHANEAVSKFECSLALGAAPDNFSACSSGKTYMELADGTYTFKARTTDKAGNQSTPEPFPLGTYAWTVENTVPDTIAPETTINSHPPDPSDSSEAAFTYGSNEAGSTFECKLDEAGFAGCPTAGVAYSGLANGSHSFQVRAKDPSGNIDPAPAGYTFNVVSSGLEPVSIFPSASKPNTKISAKPPAKTHDRTPTLRFRSTITPATFECKLDGKPFKSCRSPLTTKSLSIGRHTIKVRAVAGGAADPTPAQASFKVVKG